MGPNPNVGQPQNPFLSMLTQMHSQQAPQAPNQNSPMLQALMSQPGGAPVGQGAGLPGVSAQQPDIQDATMPGQNPGVTKQLLQAMGALHGVITAMTDPQEIRMVRSIIVLLNQLIQRDQQVQNTRTGQLTGGQPGGMPTGQPAGQPSPSM